MSGPKSLDFIGGVLYGGVPEKDIQKHVWSSAKRLDDACQNERKTAHKIAEKAQKASRLAKVCAFFAFLNYDSVMKDELRDLGTHKANNFYTCLRDEVDNWLSNDLYDTLTLFESLRSIYRNS